MPARQMRDRFNAPESIFRDAKFRLPPPPASRAAAPPTCPSPHHSFAANPPFVAS